MSPAHLQFRRQTTALARECSSTGISITEREAADLVRVRQYYNKHKRHTDWQKSIYSRTQFQAWSRYL